MKKLLALLLILTFPILGTADYISKKWAIVDRVEENNIPFLFALSCPHHSYYNKFYIKNNLQNPTGKHYILFNNKDEQPFVRRFTSSMSQPSGGEPGEIWPYYNDEWASLSIGDSEYRWGYGAPYQKYSINRKTLKYTEEDGYYGGYNDWEWIVTSSEETKCKQVDIEEAINHIEIFELKHKNFFEERSKKAQEGNQI